MRQRRQHERTLMHHATLAKAAESPLALTISNPASPTIHCSQFRVQQYLEQIGQSLLISILPFSSGNVTFFQQPKLPPVRPSDPTVQFSVGPTVRTYTRNVPILRTFFITEFREPAAPQNLVKKTSKFSSGKVKVFQWKSQTFPVEKPNFSSGKAKLFQWKSQTFPAEKPNFSSGKVKLENAGMRLPFYGAGVD